MSEKKQLPNLEEVVTTFLKKNKFHNKPLLLGLSGGPDSIALFYALLGSDLSFEVAHIDHGWRQESAKEAQILADLCQEKGVLFHCKAVTPSLEGKNLEDCARKERLAFFKECCQKRSLAAVLLAHHLDDRAETVLKRVFEGATLRRLVGMGPQKKMEGLLLLRPLISLKKQQILAWLDHQKLSYFSDATNLDQRFLRARMRQEILPLLDKSFGKNISSSLCRLSDYALELDCYLEELFSQSPIEQRQKGLFWQPPLYILQTPFLLKLAIRHFLQQKGVTISQATLEGVALHLQKNANNKRVVISKYELTLDRGTLFLQRKNLLNLNEKKRKIEH